MSAARLGPVLALLLAVAPARAHTAASPLAVSLELERKQIAIYLRYTIEAGDDARALREQFDRDADGRLSAEEQTALRDLLVGRAAAAVAVQVNGAALVPTPSGEALLDLEPGDAARLAVVARFDAGVEWKKGANQVRVAVELPDARAVTMVSVRAAKKTGLALAKDYRGGEASRGAPLELTVTRK